jgi:hypothetical protein
MIYKWLMMQILSLDTYNTGELNTGILKTQLLRM